MGNLGLGCGVHASLYLTTEYFLVAPDTRIKMKSMKIKSWCLANGSSWKGRTKTTRLWGWGELEPKMRHNHDDPAPARQRSQRRCERSIGIGCGDRLFDWRPHYILPYMSWGRKIKIHVINLHARSKNDKTFTATGSRWMYAQRLGCRHTSPPSQGQGTLRYNRTWI